MTGSWIVVTATLAGGVVTAFYLARRQPPRVLVSFDGLWADLPGTKAVRGRRPRIRHVGSWMIQLLIMGLIMMSVSPRGSGDLLGRHVVVLVDRSASMAAGPKGRTRMDRARAAIGDVLATAGSNDRIMLMSFAATPVAETGFESDPARILSASNLLTALPQSDDADQAVALAEQALRGKSRPELVLVTDQDPDISTEKLSPTINRRIKNVGDSAGNLAVESLRITRSWRIPSRATVSFRVMNHGLSARRVRVALRVDDRVVATHEDSLAPEGSLTRTGEYAIDGSAAVDLRIISPEEDSLLGDNVMTTTLPILRKRRVWVVGAPNLYLQSALSALGSSVEVQQSGASEAIRRPREGLVIFDGAVPTPPPSRGRFLYLGPVGPGHPFPGGISLNAPVVTDQDTTHPVMAGVSLRDLNITSAQALHVTPEDRVVAANWGKPLIATRERPGLRIVAIAFDPRRSDLPLRPALPLLVANALDWLDDRPDNTTVDALAPIPVSEGAMSKTPSTAAWTPFPKVTQTGRPSHDIVPALLLVLAVLLLGEWISRSRRWTS